jgi:hypothetical protein
MFLAWLAPFVSLKDGQKDAYVFRSLSELDDFVSRQDLNTYDLAYFENYPPEAIVDFFLSKGRNQHHFTRKTSLQKIFEGYHANDWVRVYENPQDRYGEEMLFQAALDLPRGCRFYVCSLDDSKYPTQEWAAVYMRPKTEIIWKTLKEIHEEYSLDRATEPCESSDDQEDSA